MLYYVFILYFYGLVHGKQLRIRRVYKERRKIILRKLGRNTSNRNEIPVFFTRENGPRDKSVF